MSGRETSRSDRAHDAREFFAQHTDVLSKNPAARSRTPEGRMPQGRGSGVRFFRLPFFSQKKKGDPSAGWRTELAQDARDAVLDERAIPAFAGMTSFTGGNHSALEAPPLRGNDAKRHKSDSSFRWNDEQRQELADRPPLLKNASSLRSNDELLTSQ